MQLDRTLARTNALSTSAIILGLLGAAFYWWTPLGIVLSLAGVTVGFISWVTARRRSSMATWPIVGMIVSLAALAAGVIVAAYGWETVRFGPLR